MRAAQGKGPRAKDHAPAPFRPNYPRANYYGMILRICEIILRLGCILRMFCDTRTLGGRDGWQQTRSD
ncbi:MAG: hypothetical protein ACJA06_001813 [Halocynthiibacter sp.]|jgi:hypothetical protein